MAVSTKVVKDKAKKKKGSSRILFWSAECKYSVIIDRVNELDWKLVDDEKQESKCNVFWIDVASIHEHFKTIQPWQTINHFPGMPNVARKKSMGQNLNRLLKIFPKEYAFYPRTWILPGEMADFRNQFDSNGNSIGNKIFIIKPDAGCQGRGIYLTKTFEKVPLNENVVAQLYIKKPLLIDNFKFDLRLYCIVTSVKPLRVYLFHDGLVRMCTEEYVKPNKQNLDQSCMHLTNYAVNKHNENFLQPGSDEGDSGSKRSLQWFMDWVRSDHGDAKADWLWNRMGVLCMRTLLSILPVLSKQYDDHFKSFTGVPIDIRKISTSTAYAPQPSGGLPGSINEGSRAGRVQSRSGSFKNDGANRANESGEENSSADEQGDGRAGTAGGASTEGKNENTQSSTSAAEHESEGEGAGEEESGPKIRGSRCFEVLGYDIMIDANLNPWIIEVNHLPSFGTDSALDRDIKERLMEQVFSVLPVLPDDQQAYALHHKAESEKRLVAQSRTNALLAKKEKEAKEKELKDRAKPPLRPREPKPLRTEAAVAEAAAKAEAERLREEAQRTAEQGEEDDEAFDEECTPERLQEIKAILYDIYLKYSQEKLNKIDRLLAKYVQHEEEFLRFVFGKYNVPPSQYKNFLEKQRLAAEAAAAGGGDQGPDATSPGSTESTENADGEPSDRAQTADTNETAGEEGGQDTADEGGDGKQELNVDTSEGANTARGPKTESNTNRNQNRETSKRASRSMSPPRSQNLAGSSTNTASTRRAWKNTEQEDALFREQVLAIHIPKEDDEWLLFETSKLTMCTRIFPIPKAAASESSSSSAKAGVSAEEQLEAQPDEQEEEDGEEGKDGTTTKDGIKEAAKPVAKSATYEEIIYQAFLADKRQTMRMSCPLPNRARVIDDNVSSFLPPLDGPSSSRSNFSSLGSGKGAVGWKAPPKPTREAVVKQPTQGQSDAAKRLSQGLSVASNHTARHRYGGQNHPSMPNALANTGYSVVLDPHEYQQVGSAGSIAGGPMQAPNGSVAAQAAGTAGIGNAYIPVYGGVYPTFQKDGAKPENINWPSTKANRLLEESRLNRMRLEAAKATSAAVVRQQVFYFDPNYRDQMGGGTGTDGLTLIPPTVGQGTSASTGGLLGGGVDSHGSVVDDGGSVANNSQFQYGGAGRNMYGTGATGGSAKVRNAPPPISHGTRHASTGNINANFQAAATAYSNGTSNHTQEELLRQLFPSWF